LPRKAARAEDGSFYLDALFALMILLALILSFLAIPEIFIKKQEIDYIARTVARRIEQDGMAGGAVEAEVARLAAETGVAAAVEWDGAFQGPEERLQIRGRFIVRVRFTVRVKLADPAFLAPVYLDVPIQKDVSGVSEVYWKDLP
jgi:hypothetical protein